MGPSSTTQTSSSFYSEPSERTVIAYLLCGKKQGDIFAELDSSDYFWFEKYRKIYQASLDLKGKGKNVDFMSLSNELKGKVKGYELLDVVTDNPKNSDVLLDIMLDHDVAVQACKTVKENWIKRTVYLQMHEGKNIGEIRHYLDLNVRSRGRFFDAKQLSDFYLEVMRQRKKEGNILFPFQMFNRATMGMRGGQYIILAARPSVGKSSMLENIAFNSAEDGHKVLFATAEMDTESLTTRILSRLSGIDLFRKEPDSEEEVALVGEAVNRLKKSGLYMFDKGAMNVLELESQLKKEKFNLVCIDYLSLLEPAHKYRSLYEKVTFCSQELKALAVKYNCAFLVASQYNRMAANVRPDLSHLRESGAIEQDADVVVSLYKKKNDVSFGSKDKVYIDLLKNRTGWTFGNTKDREYFLWFEKSKTQFTEPI